MSVGIIVMVGVEEGEDNGIQQLGFRNWNMFLSGHGNFRNALLFVIVVVVLPALGFQGSRGDSEGRGTGKKKASTRTTMGNWGEGPQRRHHRATETDHVADSALSDKAVAL